MMRACFSIFLAALLAQYVQGKAIDASRTGEASNMEITKPPVPRRTYLPKAFRRDSASIPDTQLDFIHYYSTCGTYSVPNFLLVSYPGDHCLIDYSGLYFGSCLNTTSEACWPEICSDSFACTSGCGRTSVPNLSTLTCDDAAVDHCATWYLVTSTYTYSSLACDRVNSTRIFSATAFTPTSDTSDLSSSASSSSSSSGSSSTTPAAASFVTTVTAVVSPTPAAASNQPSATPSSAGNKGGSSKTAAAVGGAVGGLGAVCIIVAALFFGARWLKRYRRKHSPVPTTEPDHDPELDGRALNSELDGGNASRFAKNKVVEKGNDKDGITEIDGQTIQEMIHENRPTELPA